MEVSDQPHALANLTLMKKTQFLWMETEWAIAGLNILKERDVRALTGILILDLPICSQVAVLTMLSRLWECADVYLVMEYKELVVQSSQKITVIWHVVQRGLLDRHNYFGGDCFSSFWISEVCSYLKMGNKWFTLYHAMKDKGV